MVGGERGDEGCRNQARLVLGALNYTRNGRPEALSRLAPSDTATSDSVPPALQHQLRWYIRTGNVTKLSLDGVTGSEPSTRRRWRLPRCLCVGAGTVVAAGHARPAVTCTMIMHPDSHTGCT